MEFHLKENEKIESLFCFRLGACVFIPFISTNQSRHSLKATRDSTLVVAKVSEIILLYSTINPQLGHVYFSHCIDVSEVVFCKHLPCNMKVDFEQAKHSFP
jgi:hypothetical protein